MIFKKIQRTLGVALTSALLFVMLAPMAPNANAASQGSVELTINHPATYSVETENGRVTVNSEGGSGSDYIVIGQSSNPETDNRTVYEERDGYVTDYASMANSVQTSYFGGQGNQVVLEVPDYGYSEGDWVEVFSSNTGHQWTSRGVALVQSGRVAVQCGHYPYFSLEKRGPWWNNESMDDPMPEDSALFRYYDTVGHWAEPYIRKITEMGIAVGKGNGLFGPDDILTRAELTKMAVKAFGIEVPTTVQRGPFVDVPFRIWYGPYVAAAKDAGIVRGSIDGRFNPENPVTRAEALKILIGTANFEDLDENFDANYLGNPGWWYASFKDVPLDSWFAKYVAYARDNTIVSGFEDGLFHPDQFMTRGEVAKVLVRVLQLKGKI